MNLDKFLSAVESGDTQTVTNGLRQKPLLINLQNAKGNTALHKAAEEDNVSMIDTLINLGAKDSVSIKNFYGNTPLCVWAEKGTNFYSLRSLLNAKSKTEEENNFHDTALHILMNRADFVKDGKHSKISLVELILNNSDEKILKKKNNYGKTVLHLASKTNSGKPLMKMILEKPEKLDTEYLDAQDQKGLTPLHEAIYSGDPEVVELLIEKGCLTHLCDLKQKSVLHFAANCNNTSWAMVRNFLWCKKDLEGKPHFLVNLTDDEKYTPLHYAVKKQNVDLVMMLLSDAVGGASSINSKTNDGKTPLKLVTELDKINFHILEALLKASASPSIGDQKGETPLHRAVFRCDEKAASMLIEATLEKDVNAKNNFGHTALYLSAIRENFFLFSKLIKKKASVTMTDSLGQNILHLILRPTFENIPFLKNVLGLGDGIKPALEMPDKDGYRPLHRAVLTGRIEVVKCFVGLVDLNSVTAEGDTALHLASRKERSDIITLLEQNGAN